MGVFPALDVSQESTAICVIDAAGGAIVAEGKVTTCPGDLDMACTLVRSVRQDRYGDRAARGLALERARCQRAADRRSGRAPWSAALKMMPNKTDRRDARGVLTGLEGADTAWLLFSHTYKDEDLQLLDALEEHGEVHLVLADVGAALHRFVRGRGRQGDGAEPAWQ